MNLAYVAGLMDGEGSIGFTRSRNVVIPRVSITNTDLELLEDLKAAFGGHIQKLTRTNDKWKTAYAWVLNNSKAVDFIEKIELWLRVKKEQSWLLYAWDAIRPGYGRVWDDAKRDALTMINAQSKWLNYRGVGRAEISPIDAELKVAA